MRPQVLPAILIYSFSSAVGQNFIYYTVTEARRPAVRACAHPQPALAVSPPVARSQNFFDLLPKVKKITLENNALKSLPPSVGGAKSLVSFNLNSNQIEELPAELARLPLEARTACRVLTDALALTLTLTVVPTLIRYSSCPTTS